MKKQPEYEKYILESAVKDMNAKLEEARRLSEEKGLPFEYVKQMLEYMEQTSSDTTESPFSDFTDNSPRPRPIPEKTVMFWAEEATELFEQIMPPISTPFPPVYTSTASSYSRTRRKIIKNIGCPHTEEPPDSIMEYIHGENGNAILIRRELIADLPVQDDRELYIHFQHFFWHELGHFYAINAETDNLHRYNAPGLTDDSPVYDAAIDGCGYSSERRKQEGYWFWQEFIAEVISNHVSYTIRSSGDSYHPELLDWTIDVWGGIVNKLEDLLEGTLYLYSSTIDEYALAHYFARLLTDDLTVLYVKAANEGKLKVDSGAYPDEKIEPTCISDVSECYQPHLWKMHEILVEQLSKKQFWLIDEDTLEKIGSCIGDMMVEKIKEMAREYEEC